MRLRFQVLTSLLIQKCARAIFGCPSTLSFWPTRLNMTTSNVLRQSFCCQRLLCIKALTSIHAYMQPFTIVGGGRISTALMNMGSGDDVRIVPLGGEPFCSGSQCTFCLKSPWSFTVCGCLVLFLQYVSVLTLEPGFLTTCWSRELVVHTPSLVCALQGSAETSSWFNKSIILGHNHKPAHPQWLWLSMHNMNMELCGWYIISCAPRRELLMV
jgi:hypothetical protein